MNERVACFYQAHRQTDEITRLEKCRPREGQRDR